MSKEQIAEKSGQEMPKGGVIDLLKKQKAEREAPVSVTLPESGIECLYPGFVSHQTIMNVYKKSGGEKGKLRMAAVAISELCTFGAAHERLSATDVAELLPNRDVTFLSGKCLGVETEDDEGN